MFVVRASYNVGAFAAKKTVDFNLYPYRAIWRQTVRPRQAAVDVVAGIVSPLFSVSPEDIKLDEALLAPKATATTATLMGDSVTPALEGDQATTTDDGSASTSAASVEPAAAETEDPEVTPTARVFLPAPTQAVTLDKEAERAELVRQMKDAWPARCQVANERLITSLQRKLRVAENKITDLTNTNKTLVDSLSDVTSENASLKQQLRMLRDVLSSRTNNISTATQPASTAEASASRVPGVSPVREDGRSSLTAASKTKNGVTVRSANQRWTKDQENVRSASGPKKSSGSAWRPPLPSSSAVTPTVTKTAKAPKPTVRRAWSWADEADLSEEEQKLLLDKYLRENPDPFNEGRQ